MTRRSASDGLGSLDQTPPADADGLGWRCNTTPPAIRHPSALHPPPPLLSCTTAQSRLQTVLADSSGVNAPGQLGRVAKGQNSKEEQVLPEIHPHHQREKAGYLKVVSTRIGCARPITRPRSPKMGIPGRHGLRGAEHGAMRLLRRGVVGRDERLGIITLMMPVSQEGPGAVSRLDFVAGWVVSGSRNAGKL